MLKILHYDNIGWDLWQDFAGNSSSAWFYHTRQWIEICLNLSESNINESFGVLEDNQLVAIVPLILLEYDGRKAFSFGMCNTPYPAFLNDLSQTRRRKLEKYVMDRIFELAVDRKVDYINFFISPLVDEVLNKALIVSPIPRFGFQDVSIASNILHLDRNEETIWGSLRKGTKESIKKAAKDGYVTEIIDATCYDITLFRRYREIHFQAAGRKTRPDVTWDIMSDWIRDGYSILALLKAEGVYISGTVINTYKERAYYQSAATLPQFRQQTGISHLLQWELIRYLRKKGFAHYELGWDFYPNISQEVADDAMINISKFKAGFGRDKYPLFRGEYFFNKDYMISEYGKRLESFAGHCKQTR